MRSHRRAVAFVLLLAALASGCVARERRAVAEAREATEACVAEKGAASPECQSLRGQLRADRDRYEENARRGWGCDPGQDDCPTAR